MAEYQLAEFKLIQVKQEINEFGAALAAKEMMMQGGIVVEKPKEPPKEMPKTSAPKEIPKK